VSAHGRAPLARVRVAGRELRAGAAPLRVWGFNWGLGDRYPILDYFDDPTAERLDGLAAELRTAARLGANAMRVYLELGQVMESPTRPREATLGALRGLLDLAERERVYLDVTGNLVWRPELVPGWYDGLEERARWQVQTRFWHAVAATAASSPAVLCYELTSEPIVGETDEYYTGELAGYTFVQSIATRNNRSGRRLARAWTRRLAAAVRRHDDRPVSIGLLPSLHHGGFTPANVADLLDLLVVHEYPRRGFAELSVAVVRDFAAFGKPVLLGETFLGEGAPLLDDPATLGRFLRGANPHVVGVLEFFDGRDPAAMEVESPADGFYRAAVQQFVALRAELLTARPPASDPDGDPTEWLAVLPQVTGFGVLLMLALGRRLSPASARRLLGRLEDAFGGRLPAPAEVLDGGPAVLARAGVSPAKARTVLAVAQAFAHGDVRDEELITMSDTEVVRRLTAIPGIGPRTARRFLVLSLNRRDALGAGPGETAPA
jgi:hypothetical protein